ncbi:hypothetical protein [Marinobacter sp.]|uniref:hypothetical protein n=1 Tax=Marinobacter sp. TaxID=50741 RepID=UPI0023557714|nr:hypothetical protein [Marinobacter sp.]
MQAVADQLAEFGRHEDNYIVHASEGETVIPMAVLDRNPDLKNNLFEQMRQMGLDPERYIVGNELNSINPVTGQPEFFLKRVGRGLKKAFKKIAPVVLPVLAASTPLGPIYGAMAGTGIASLAQGKSLKKSFRDALISGGIAGLSRGLQGMGTDAGFLGTIRQDLQSPGARFAGTLTGRGVGKGEYFGKPFDVSRTYNQTAAGTPDFRQEIYNPTNTAQNNLFAKAAEIKTNAAQAGFSITDDTALKQAGEAIKASKPSFLSKYGPTIGLGALGLGAFGAFDEPEDEEQVDFFADSPKYQPGTPLGDANQRLLTSGGVGQPRPFTPVAMENVVVPSRFSTRYAAEGGEIDRQYFPPRIGAISGPGTGTSDDVPAMLSDGEFVMTAKAVRGAGNGSREQGMRNMYDIMRRFEGGAVGMADGGAVDLGDGEPSRDVVSRPAEEYEVEKLKEMYSAFGPLQESGNVRMGLGQDMIEVYAPIDERIDNYKKMDKLQGVIAALINNPDLLETIEIPSLSREDGSYDYDLLEGSNIQTLFPTELTRKYGYPSDYILEGFSSDDQVLRSNIEDYPSRYQKIPSIRRQP